MNVPVFKRSQIFVDQVRLPCLAGKFSHRELPGLGRRFKDPKDGRVDVYLRGRKPDERSDWHDRWLHDLFEREQIVPAIKTGMREYEKSERWCGFKELEHQDLQDIKRIGILPFLRIRLVVLDQEEERILIRLVTDKDFNLEEHGITIHWKRGRWRFGYADVLSEYLRDLDLADDETQEPPQKREASDVYGRWVFDEKTTLKILKGKRDAEEIRHLVKIYKGSSYQISPKVLELSCRERVWTAKIISLKLAGQKLRLTAKYPQADGSQVIVGKFCGENLVLDDLALRRVD